MLHGDTVTALRDEADLPPVGVFFYDADHSTEATRAALEAVTQPSGRDRALIVVDDAEWAKVQAATDAFLAAHAERGAAACGSPAAGAGQPWWWDGMDVIAWTRE